MARPMDQEMTAAEKLGDDPYHSQKKGAHFSTGATQGGTSIRQEASVDRKLSKSLYCGFRGKELENLGKQAQD